MSKFRDHLTADLKKTFFSLDELGELHNIDGVDRLIIVDNDLLRERSRLGIFARIDEGVHQGDILYFIQKSDLAKRPVVGQPQKFDGKLHTVFSVGEDEGMYEITLGANFS